MLIILGLIFIFASYSELDGPLSGRSLTDEERDYWAPKCIDWLSNAHPYWMSDGSNMCFEYEKGWNYTTVAIGVLMIIGGIACFFDFAQNEALTSKTPSDTYVSQETRDKLKNVPILGNKIKEREEQLWKDKEKTVENKKIKKSVKEPIEERKPTEKNDELINELKKLNELKEQGILDDDEFKAAKQKIIKKW